MFTNTDSYPQMEQPAIIYSGSSLCWLVCWFSYFDIVVAICTHMVWIAVPYAYGTNNCTIRVWLYHMRIRVWYDIRIWYRTATLIWVFAIIIKLFKKRWLLYKSDRSGGRLLSAFAPSVAAFTKRRETLQLAVDRGSSRPPYYCTWKELSLK